MVDRPVTFAPLGGLADTVAVLAMEPASKLACVTVLVLPVQVAVTVAFGAMAGVVQERPASSGSDTDTFVSVTLPVFFT